MGVGIRVGVGNPDREPKSRLTETDTQGGCAQIADTERRRQRDRDTRAVVRCCSVYQIRQPYLVVA